MIGSARLCLGSVPIARSHMGAVPDDLAEQLDALFGDVGKGPAAKSLGISSAQLKTLTVGAALRRPEDLLSLFAARLPAAARQADMLREDRFCDLAELRQAVERDGLRATARRLGVDPSNLRRRLRPTTE